MMKATFSTLAGGALLAAGFLVGSCAPPAHGQVIFYDRPGYGTHWRETRKIPPTVSRRRNWDRNAYWRERRVPRYSQGYRYRSYDYAPRYGSRYRGYEPYGYDRYGGRAWRGDRDDRWDDYEDYREELEERREDYEDWLEDRREDREERLEELREQREEYREWQRRRWRDRRGWFDD